MPTQRRHPDRARPRADVALARHRSPRASPAVRDRAASSRRPSARPPRRRGTEACRAPKRASCASPTLDWRDFAADVDACMACGLSRTRKKTVPGVGDVRAEWLFVGEAPGAEEDAKGEPFVGQAGKLLDNMLAALGMTRGENVYIANVLKCRPPSNRTPEPRRGRRLPPVPRPADRAHRAQGDRRARQERRDDAARRSTRRSRACAGASTATAASRSSSPIIRPTCCATCPTRRRRGRICCSRGARCAAAARRRGRPERIEPLRTPVSSLRACVRGPPGPKFAAVVASPRADAFRPEEP